MMSGKYAKGIKLLVAMVGCRRGGLPGFAERNLAESPRQRLRRMGGQPTAGRSFVIPPPRHDMANGCRGNATLKAFEERKTDLSPRYPDTGPMSASISAIT